MRKVKLGLVFCAGVAAACGGRGEFIPTPTPAPELPTSTSQLISAVLGAAPTTLAATTTTEPAPTTTVAPSTSASRNLRPVATTASTPVPRSSSNQLAAIRQCESHGDYTTNTGNGYYGAYQFALSTWQSVGGSGYPHLASPAEQDMRAQMMIDAGRRGEWPNC